MSAYLIKANRSEIIGITMSAHNAGNLIADDADIISGHGCNSGIVDFSKQRTYVVGTTISLQL